MNIKELFRSINREEVIHIAFPNAILGVVLIVGFINMHEIQTMRSSLTKITESTIEQSRVIAGNYQDYLVVNTIDGNTYFVTDELMQQAAVEADGPEPDDGELVQLRLNTHGTKNVVDDTVVSMRVIRTYVGKE